MITFEPAATTDPTAPPIPEATPRPPRKRGRTLAIVAGAIALCLLLLGGGAAFANASLSSTYSAGRAVTDYFGAMSRGDVAYMLANANYPKGDGGPDNYFLPASVTAMMALNQNRAVTNVRVTSAADLDANTSRVGVSLNWAGKSTSKTYVVHRDPARKHYVFYTSWRIDIPASTITVQLPPQPGGVGVDGIYGQSVSTVSVIQGFHELSMHESDFYDTQTAGVDATGDTAVVDFSSAQLSATAVSAAANAIRESFQPANITCDVGQNFDCPNHKYTLPAGFYFVLEMPGGNVTVNRSWVFTLTGDPTVGMKLEVGDRTGVVAASGTCTEQMLVDGSKKYQYRGTWHGTLTWSNGGFAYDGTSYCDQFKA